MVLSLSKLKPLEAEVSHVFSPNSPKISDVTRLGMAPAIAAMLRLSPAVTGTWRGRTKHGESWMRNAEWKHWRSQRGIKIHISQVLFDSMIRYD